MSWSNQFDNNFTKTKDLIGNIVFLKWLVNHITGTFDGVCDTPCAAHARLSHHPHDCTLVCGVITACPMCCGQHPWSPHYFQSLCPRTVATCYATEKSLCIRPPCCVQCYYPWTWSSFCLSASDCTSCVIQHNSVFSLSTIQQSQNSEMMWREKGLPLKSGCVSCRKLLFFNNQF